jgi:hypothetical protein
MIRRLKMANRPNVFVNFARRDDCLVEVGATMAKIRVFQVLFWDPKTNRWDSDEWKYTEAALRKFGEAKIWPGRDEEVDESELDEKGRYFVGAPPSEKA